MIKLQRLCVIITDIDCYEKFYHDPFLAISPSPTHLSASHRVSWSPNEGLFCDYDWLTVHYPLYIFSWVESTCTVCAERKRLLQYNIDKQSTTFHCVVHTDCTKMQIQYNTMSFLRTNHSVWFLKYENTVYITKYGIIELHQKEEKKLQCCRITFYFKITKRPLNI